MAEPKRFTQEEMQQWNRRILQAIDDGNHRFTDILGAVDASKGTVSKYLKELKNANVVYQDEDKKYYIRKIQPDERDLIAAVREAGDEIAKEELMDALNLDEEYLEQILNRLNQLEWAYLRQNDRVVLGPRALEEKNACAECGGALGDKKVIAVAREGVIGTYTYKYHPDCLNKTDGHIPEGAIEASGDLYPPYCNYCGLPLHPATLTQCLNPRQFFEAMDIEAEEFSLSSVIQKLYGPIGAAYLAYEDHGADPVHDLKEAFPYHQEGENQYHPYCYQQVNAE